MAQVMYAGSAASPPWIYAAKEAAAATDDNVEDKVTLEAALERDTCQNDSARAGSEVGEGWESIKAQWSPEPAFRPAAAAASKAQDIARKLL